jgi:hypothetical protein
MTCQLPLAGLRLERQIQLDGQVALFHVEERITNPSATQKPFNLVQHPTLGGAFLDVSSRLDCCADAGWVQSDQTPADGKPNVQWPLMQWQGTPIDLHHGPGTLKGNLVVSFPMDSKKSLGWATLMQPRMGLLIGYLWPNSEYPWLNLWYGEDHHGNPARGIEFGTTGMHQDFSKLLTAKTLFGKPLYQTLDPGAVTSKSYWCFLISIPGTLTQVTDVSIQGNTLTIEGKEGDQAYKQILPVSSNAL